MGDIPDIPTINVIFSDIELSDGSSLSKKEVSKLVKLKRYDKKPMFTVDTGDLVMNTITMINKIGFEQSYDHLKNTKKSSDIEIIKNFPIYRQIRKNIFLEMTSDMIIKQITDSVHKCQECDSRNVSFNMVQLRGSDEPPTTIFKCNNCDHGWRSG
jgi:DNA-directed RNA polymerase subunit M/transcription elongation factor TFIIS